MGINEHLERMLLRAETLMARIESVLPQALHAPDWRASFDAGRFELVPQAYSQAWTWLETTPLDAAIVQVSAPNSEGLCSLGPSVDFQPTVLSRNLLRVAHINRALPAPHRPAADQAAGSLPTPPDDGAAHRAPRAVRVG